jgi:hypothetical protein
VTSDDKKRMIVSTMLDRIESLPHLVAATAPIFRLSKLEKPQFFATAVLLKVNNCHFALTAAHVLDERSISNLYIGSGEKVVLLGGSFGTTVPPGAGNRKQDRIDIGIVRLSEETVRDMQEDEFLTLDDTYNLETVTTTGHYVFRGYPISKHKRAIKGGQAEATPYTFVVVPAPLADYQNAYLNPSISLLLRFDKQNLWLPSGRVVGPDPTGISGGGVWFLDNAFATSPLKPLLCAIAIEWWKNQHKCVLATKLHVALSLIRSRFPELRPYLPEPPHESKNDL